MQQPPKESSTNIPGMLRVLSGEDHSGEHHPLGISVIDFKITGQENSGIFVLENTFHAKGGPARHLHIEQDEWFYALEGEFLFEVGSERFRLYPGDTLLAPRNIPHVWAFDGEKRGRILITFLPAGKMEAFFREVAKANTMPAQDPALWRAHGMELLGPPLKVG
jgi:quercetin dioxygenase-like cupin family protein